MKKILFALILMMGFVSQSHAAPVSLQSIDTLGTTLDTLGTTFVLSDTFEIGIGNVTAYHGLVLASAPDKLTSFLLDDTNREGETVNYNLYEAVFAGFTATLGNSLLSWTDIDTAGTPGGTNLQSYLMDSNKEYVLSVSTAGQPFIQSVSTVVTSVPVPAAIWLFGSALMGLVGLSRRKASVNGLTA